LIQTNLFIMLNTQFNFYHVYATLVIFSVSIALRLTIKIIICKNEDAKSASGRSEWLVHLFVLIT